MKRIGMWKMNACYEIMPVCKGLIGCVVRLPIYYVLYFQRTSKAKNMGTWTAMICVVCGSRDGPKQPKNSRF